VHGVEEGNEVLVRVLLAAEAEAGRGVEVVGSFGFFSKVRERKIPFAFIVSSFLLSSLFFFSRVVCASV
jgi:hypothetical protein